MDAHRCARAVRFRGGTAWTAIFHPTMSEDEDLTEHEWLTCTDPARMLGHLFPSNSDRRDRLFAVACCRRIWHLIEDPRRRHAVETAERFVEGLADEDELQAAAEQAISKESGRHADR